MSWVPSLCNPADAYTEPKVKCPAADAYTHTVHLLKVRKVMGFPQIHTPHECPEPLPAQDWYE